MSKRRTKKQKQKAIHHFALTWSNEPKKSPSQPLVKGQFENKPNQANTLKPRSKNAVPTAKETSQDTIKHNILKSLLILSFILALEVVVYLVWR